MALSQINQDDLCVQLRAVGVPERVLLPLVTTISLQVQAEGPENVVRRLKTLKQAAVNLISGVPYSLDWIAHTEAGPKGPFKPVWRWLKSQRHKTKVKALNTMMVYAHVIIPARAGPTPTQERKFLNSVVLSETEVKHRQEKLGRALNEGGFRKGVSLLKRSLLRNGWKPDCDEGSVYIDDYLARKYGTDRKAVRKAEKQLNVFLGREAFYPFHAYPQVQKTLGELGEDSFDLTHPWNGRHLDWRKVIPSEDPIGVIGYSQEPGAKLRAFASPNWVVQASTQGLKACLLDALKRCEWDCTHDQMKGVYGVQRWLAEGRKIFSVDLSDATNNFPLKLQLMTLNFLGIPEEEVSMLSLLSTSKFRKLWGDGECVSWSVGQPLGAGPSFMAFALTHAAVALEAELEAGVPNDQSGSTFYILGDDIVISDERVHDAYRKLLGVLSCPISESKCLQSSVAGEFAGKLITETHVYHGYKYRGLSDISFMDVIKGLGPQAVKVLTSAQRAYVELVKELPEPYGLGWNPKGRPLAERYAVYLDTVETLEQAEPDIRTRRPEELRMQFMYGLNSRWVRYFEAERQRIREPIRSSKALGRERVLDWARGDVALESPVILDSGDPRVNPIKGWTRSKTKRIIPAIERARERYSERVAA